MKSRSLVVLVVLFALAACASDERPPFSPSFSEGLDAGAGESGRPLVVACEDAATHVYVMSDESDLYRFRPGQLLFEKVGHVSCDVMLPNSMAVDRFGYAWVNYKSGNLYRVDTRNASCARTDYVPGQGGFATFGSAFATKGPGSVEETLFADGTKGDLGRIDATSLKFESIGQYDGTLAGSEAELTGTGDGRLYGFFTTKPNATLARIDQTTAKTSELRVLDGVNTGRAWAFSFWGGDFWFYTANEEGAPSVVTRLRTDEDRLEVVVPDVGGFRIVGAGVSTCAPLTSPR